MELKKLSPLFTTKGQLPELSAFYQTHFGFKIVHEMPGYLGLVARNGAELAFMTEDEDATEPFGGKGLTLCFEVGDVDSEARRLEKAGLPVVRTLRDNPWGDRSVIFRDPIGVHVYVYQAKSN